MNPIQQANENEKRFFAREQRKMIFYTLVGLITIVIVAAAYHG